MWQIPSKSEKKKTLDLNGNKYLLSIPVDKFLLSNFILLAAWQANKLRDKLLGQGNVTLFPKPADWDKELIWQRTIWPELELRLFLY